MARTVASFACRPTPRRTIRTGVGLHRFVEAVDIITAKFRLFEADPSLGQEFNDKFRGLRNLEFLAGSVVGQ